ncbi:hypothetical protein C8R45DRAFT_921703 [Mycena sanguinolenta]|nr:hypothetical protein C8R45DRAFT_921703 [Mycena sanguinolenta]
MTGFIQESGLSEKTPNIKIIAWGIAIQESSKERRQRWGLLRAGRGTRGARLGYRYRLRVGINAYTVTLQYACTPVEPPKHASTASTASLRIANYKRIAGMITVDSRVVLVHLSSSTAPRSARSEYPDETATLGARNRQLEELRAPWGGECARRDFVWLLGAHAQRVPRVLLKKRGTQPRWSARREAWIHPPPVECNHCGASRLVPITGVTGGGGVRARGAASIGGLELLEEGLRTRSGWGWITWVVKRAYLMADFKDGGKFYIHSYLGSLPEHTAALQLAGLLPAATAEWPSALDEGVGAAQLAGVGNRTQWEAATGIAPLMPRKQNFKVLHIPALLCLRSSAGGDRSERAGDAEDGEEDEERGETEKGWLRRGGSIGIDVNATGGKLELSAADPDDSIYLGTVQGPQPQQGYTRQGRVARTRSAVERSLLNLFSLACLSQQRWGARRSIAGVGGAAKDRTSGDQRACFTRGAVTWERWRRRRRGIQGIMMSCLRLLSTTSQTERPRCGDSETTAEETSPLPTYILLLSEPEAERTEHPRVFGPLATADAGRAARLVLHARGSRVRANRRWSVSGVAGCFRTELGIHAWFNSKTVQRLGGARPKQPTEQHLFGGQKYVWRLVARPRIYRTEFRGIEAVPFRTGGKERPGATHLVPQIGDPARVK